MKANQKGFAAVETLLIVVIIGLIAGVGYYVWHANKEAKATLDAASKAAQSLPEKAIKKTATPSQQFLVIQEWGIKIGFADANKVVYRVGSNSAVKYEYATLLLKPSIASSNCQNLGVGFVRDEPSAGTIDRSTVKTVAGHSYHLEGAPGACGDSAIDLLRQKIDGQELGQGNFTISAID